ncbi:MAG: hypothetical protein Fur0046_19170 [Cyanobacteria bacterium J069]
MPNIAGQIQPSVSIQRSPGTIAHLGRSALWQMAGLAIASTVLLTGGEALAQVYSFGSQGSAVSAIQSALGIYADGVYGPATEDAVAAFQARNGLAVDGQAGPQTLQALGLGYLVGGVGGPSQPVPPVGSIDRDAIVRTNSGIGVIVRDRPNGFQTGGLDEGQRVRLTGRREFAGGINWAELADRSGWVASEYLVPFSIGGPTYPGGPGYYGGPYRVAIPGNSDELLFQVRRFAPNAYRDSDARGRFINAGSYRDYGAAAAENQRLRNLGLDARVIYE